MHIYPYMIYLFENARPKTLQWWDHSVKFSCHYPSSKTIKNPPVLQVSRWSLGGHGGSWHYFSTYQSLKHALGIIWWSFQVWRALLACYLTIRNLPILQVKKLESWRTGWFLVRMLADQAMSTEYFLKVWAKLAHCALSYDHFCKRGSDFWTLLCSWYNSVMFQIAFFQ